MKLTYDPEYNVAYIRFREETAEVETIRLSDEILVDVAPDGAVYGIELLIANKQLAAYLVVEGAAPTPATIPLKGGQG